MSYRVEQIGGRCVFFFLRGLWFLRLVLWTDGGSYSWFFMYLGHGEAVEAFLFVVALFFPVFLFFFVPLISVGFETCSSVGSGEVSLINPLVEPYRARAQGGIYVYMIQVTFCHQTDLP